MELSESSAEFNNILESYEKWVRDTMESTILFKECRPYSATSGKYYIFNDEELGWDPYGFYTGGPIIGERVPELGHLYYPNFPNDSNAWHIKPPGDYETGEGLDDEFKKW